MYCVRVIPPQFRVDNVAMLTLAVFSIVLVIFSMVPLFSASEDADDIANVSWFYTDKFSGTDAIYIGIYKFVAADGDDNEAYDWQSGTCEFLQDTYGEHFCNECEHGGTFVIGFAAVFFVFSIFSAIAAVLRAVRNTDLLSDIILQHAVIVCSLVSFIFGITAVAVFVTTCRRYWPFSGHEYEYGAAAVMTIFVVVCKFIEIVAHALVTQEALDHSSTLQDPNCAPGP